MAKDGAVNAYMAKFLSGLPNHILDQAGLYSTLQINISQFEWPTLAEYKKLTLPFFQIFIATPITFHKIPQNMTEIGID